MKINLRFRLLTLIAFIALSAIAIPVFSQDLEAHKTIVGKVFDFLQKNWELCSVIIVSEILPILPTKTNGLLQGAIRVLNLLFKKK